MDDPKRIIVELQKLNDGQEYIGKRIDSVDKTVESLVKTVRGFNGTPGLVTQVVTLQTNIDVISKEVTELKNCINKDNKCDDDSGGKEKPQTLSKAWLLDKFEYLALAFLVWFLLEILPRILQFLDSP